jgi:hypothetical protein
MGKIPNTAALDALERLYAEFIARPVCVTESVLRIAPPAKFTASIADKENAERSAKVLRTVEPEESIIAMRILELRDRLGGLIRA